MHHQLGERAVEHRRVDALDGRAHLDDETAQERGQADEVQDEGELVCDFHSCTLAAFFAISHAILTFFSSSPQRHRLKLPHSTKEYP